MAFRFPYSNLHELNLDWILAEVKEFAELIPPMSTAVEDVAEAVSKSDQALDTANEALTVAEQASHAIISDGAVTTSKLADEAVTEAKLADYAVTNDKLASNSVGRVNIQNFAVDTLQLEDEAVTTAKLHDQSVTTQKIANGNVTWAKLATTVKNRILYIEDVVCNAMTGDFAQVANNSIDEGYVLAMIEFATPAYITSNYTWTTSEGFLKLNGTCSGATTCNVLLIKAGNIV